MKNDMLIRAVGMIDDDLIEAADARLPASHTRQQWTRLGAVAAAFVLVTAVALTAPRLLRSGDLPAITQGPATAATVVTGSDTLRGPGTSSFPVPTTHPETGGELRFEKQYGYTLYDSPYASYVGGKVIDASKLGGALKNGSSGDTVVCRVSAGWFDAEGRMLTQEFGRAEVYEILGVDTAVAVAVRFLDAFEALTTNHYYVLLNPEADLTPVQEYVITPWTVPEGPNGETPE